MAVETVPAKRYEDYTLEDIPFYRDGMTAEEFIRSMQDADYLTFQAEPVAGRKFGFNGIGKLREVGLHMPTEYTYHGNLPQFQQNIPLWTQVLGVPDQGPTDLKKFQAETEELASAFEDNGVTVHWVEFLDEPVGPYGPFMGHVFVGWGNIFRGGTVISRFGFLPGMVGVTEYLARWAWNELNIPPLVTITEGAMEAGASHWLAEDVLVTSLSCSFDEKGTNQFVDACRATSGTKEFHHLQIRPPLKNFFDPKSGACSHPDMDLMAVDVGKVVVNEAAVDPPARKWLEDNNFQIIPADPDEQRSWMAPCNIVTLEPGKVIANVECKKTNRKLQEADVEVVAVPSEEIRKHGGGNRCRTMQIYREHGSATLEDIRNRSWR
jgi:N-dimethylarginine dimethylaminohydrolase